MNALMFAFYVRPPLSARKTLITLEILSMRLEEWKHFLKSALTIMLHHIKQSDTRGAVQRETIVWQPFEKRTAFFSSQGAIQFVRELNISLPSDFSNPFTI